MQIVAVSFVILIFIRKLLKTNVSKNVGWVYLYTRTHCTWEKNSRHLPRGAAGRGEWGEPTHLPTPEGRWGALNYYPPPQAAATPHPSCSTLPVAITKCCRRRSFFPPRAQAPTPGPAQGKTTRSTVSQPAAGSQWPVGARRHQA